jgi:hypothetical protein
MKRNRLVVAGAAALVALSLQSVGADVRADQRTRIEFGGMLGRMVNLFGGRAAREGVTSTVAVSGDRKATTTGNTGQIVDLAEEKIYDLDLRRKEYKVTTFAEIRRRMEEAQKRAQGDAQREAPRSQQPSSTSDPDGKEMEFDVDVKNTGATKTINGFNTRQVIMTITIREKGRTLEQSGGMVATTDMWLTPTIAEMKEVADFDMRYAQKLYGGMFAGASAEQMAAAMALYPLMKQAMGRMSTEGAKIDGTAILTTVTMDAVKSAEQVAQEAKASESSESPSTVGGLLGGLARRAAARKNENQNPARATFMTSTVEVLKVATAVTQADLAIPTGFKENK